MKLLNFTVGDGPFPIEIKAEGLIWDLHNVMNFVQVIQNTTANTVEMRWRVDRVYARQEYPTEGFSILFADVEYFEIRQRDPTIPHSEDDCMASVSRIHAIETWENIEKYGGVPEPDQIEGEDFHFLFQFQSAQKIRIGANTAEFKMLNWL